MNYEKLSTSELLEEFMHYNDDIVSIYDMKVLEPKSSWWYFDHLPIELLAELIRRVK